MLCITVSSYSYVCRVKKYRTLLYRIIGDILATLATSLHKLSKSSHENHDGRFGTQNLSLATPCNTQLVMDDLNSLVHQLVADARISPTDLTNWAYNQRWTLHYGRQSVHLQDLYHNVGYLPSK